MKTLSLSLSLCRVIIFAFAPHLTHPNFDVTISLSLSLVLFKRNAEVDKTAVRGERAREADVNEFEVVKKRHTQINCNTHLGRLSVPLVPSISVPISPVVFVCVFSQILELPKSGTRRIDMPSELFIYILLYIYIKFQFILSIMSVSN